LFIAFLTYGSTVPYSGVNLQKSVPIRQEQFPGQQQLTNVGFEQNDESEIVDHTGGGYSFFKKQQIESRPFAPPIAPISNQDLSEYAKASAFAQQPSRTQIFTSSQDQLINGGYGQQKVIPRTNVPVQNLLPQTVLNTFGNIRSQQPTFLQNDLSQLRSSFPSGYDNQQQDLRQIMPRQQQSAYGQIQQPDLRTIVSQQILLPQTDLNIQQKTFGGYDNQQQDLSVFQQPKQTWSTQQKSVSFGSTYGGQGQQPVSSGFAIQTNQQNDMEPITTGVFMSSQAPTQRFISQSQPTQQISNDGSYTGWFHWE